MLTPEQLPGQKLAGFLSPVCLEENNRTTERRLLVSLGVLTKGGGLSMNDLGVSFLRVAFLGWFQGSQKAMSHFWGAAKEMTPPSRDQVAVDQNQWDPILVGR